MSDEKKDISKIVGKIDLEKQEKERHKPRPLKISLGDVLKQAIEKAKKNVG
jgi:hypothetical protein